MLSWLIPKKKHSVLAYEIHLVMPGCVEAFLEANPSALTCAELLMHLEATDLVESMGLLGGIRDRHAENTILCLLK